MKNKQRRYSHPIIQILIALSLTSIIPSFTLFVQADSINPGVYSKDSSPFGVPYSEWIHRWWQWNQGTPSSQHPRDNFTAQKCTVNQNGSVWFLPDILTGKEERSCTIPAGKAVLVPLLTGECHNDGKPPIMNDDELHKCASEGDEFGILSATLDGHNIQNLNQYRTQTGFGNLTVVKDNIFNNVPGTFNSSNADGFFVFLEPPSRGNHELRLTTSVLNPATPSYNYAAEVTYHLTVK
jgi:hypothetical protein